MLKRVLSLVAILAAVFCVVNPSGTAHATSVYDSAYQRQTSGMYVQTPTCSQQDITSAVNTQLASSTGWPSGPWYAHDQIRDYYQDMVSGVKQGIIAITQQTYTDSNNDVYQTVAINPVQSTGSQYLGWIADSSTDHRVRISMPPFYGIPYSGQILGFELDSSCNLQFHNIGGSSVVHISNDVSGQGMSWKSISFKTYGSPLLTFDFNYPSGYAGTPVGGTADADDDDLTASQEMEQGTLDTKVDTDGDGISDFAESKFNPDYDNTYCNTTVNPHICADPNPREKDLFVEVDWMVNGATEYKPSSTVISDLTTYYSNNGIHAHFDLGNYGGGNSLPFYTNWLYFSEQEGDLDIHDFKYGGSPADTGQTSTIAANFSLYRQNIWRYMIYGVGEISDDDSIMGIAENLGDDIIIASQNSAIQDDALHSLDRAYAGLMLHELGHTLCLSSRQWFTEQNSNCVFNAIDTYTNYDYKSVMDDLFLLPKYSDLEYIQYSDGTNGTGDHDDWAAINAGMGAFIYGEGLTIEYAKTEKGKSKHHDDRPLVKGKAQDNRNLKVQSLHLNRKANQGAH